MPPGNHGDKTGDTQQRDKGKDGGIKEGGKKEGGDSLQSER